MESILISAELACAYRWNDEFKCLDVCAMRSDGSLEFDNWGCVEEWAVGEEPVTFNEEEVTLSEVYRQVEAILKPEVEYGLLKN